MSMCCVYVCVSACVSACVSSCVCVCVCASDSCIVVHVWYDHNEKTIAPEEKNSQNMHKDISV